MEERRNYIPDGYLTNALGIDPLHHISKEEEVDIKVQRASDTAGKDTDAEMRNTADGIPKAEEERIKQTSRYSEGDRPRINNNHFFEERSNPLSSKGD